VVVVILVTNSSILKENNTFWHVITRDFLRCRYPGQAPLTSPNNCDVHGGSMKVSLLCLMMGKLCGQNTHFVCDTPQTPDGGGGLSRNCNCAHDLKRITFAVITRILCVSYILWKSPSQNRKPSIIIK
jgi:hypothetical protein